MSLMDDWKTINPILVREFVIAFKKNNTSDNNECILSEFSVS